MRFDVVWAQNAFMNIRDKDRLFPELHRVLKPGGKLVFQEPMAGPNPPLHFPVTWADRPDLSFLVSPADCRGIIEAIGFRVSHWEDITSWLSRLPQQPNPHDLSFGIFIADLQLKASNNVRNRDEGRTLQWQALCVRP
jgi:SAM-dependent methyltransferase